MTRQDFRDNMWGWWELYDFCQENGCPYLDGMMDATGRDEDIEYDLGEAIKNESWQEIRDWLSSLDDSSNAEYWLKYDDGDWRALNDWNFGDYKNDVEEWMDDNCIWDDEEEDAPYDDPDDYGKADAESVTFDVLFAASAAVVSDGFLESVTDFLTAAQP